MISAGGPSPTGSRPLRSVLALHGRPNVPLYLLKAKFSHPISLFRGNEIFQPFALATPLYSVNFRLSGGELLRLCSVVRWHTRSTGTLTSSSCLLIPILCTNGLVHGLARSALRSGAACLAAPCVPPEVFAASILEVSRQQAQKKNCWDFVHALLELAVWLQAGEDHAIAAGSKAVLKSGCRPLRLRRQVERTSAEMVEHSR
jgi:hypothetical protein